ncbi:MAG TPA: PIG-L family deacetylase [Opitutaceae bacterium]|nr:PIG-L family deacetylase [Opitutaceae bacterium]
MKPIRTPPRDPPLLLAFGAHPDDIEFGCGGVIARETQAGRGAHFVVCSRGEAGTHGTAAQRSAEARRAANLLGATLEFVNLGGDARIEVRRAHVMVLAGIMRRIRAPIVLAPTPVENQHPDHAALGRMVREAARLARYGGVRALRHWPAHAIDQLLFYAITVEGEPAGVAPVLLDVSAPRIRRAWRAAMAAHASQARTRRYLEFQEARARVQGERAGVALAMALYPNDPLMFTSLAALGRAARHI